MPRNSKGTSAGHADSNPLLWLESSLAALSSTEHLRSLITRTGPQGPVIEIDGKSFINFGSNDYLSLAADPRLVRAVNETLEQGWGSGASPLINGHGQRHAELERALADLTGCPAALLFSSGYAANSGVIPAVVDVGDAIFSDEHNHASTIDGCRLSRAKTHVYRHCDVNHLEELLSENKNAGRRLIVTDSLFSMQGDTTPLSDLAHLAKKYGCMFMVDEAHATGLYGANGSGLVEEFDVSSLVHIRVGTLSKALGSVGGFVAGSQHLIDWLANRARSFVFSTALPDATAAAALAALQIVREEPARRLKVHQVAEQVRKRIRESGWDVASEHGQIIPIIVGDAANTMKLASLLRERGLFVPGIRPPSVPQGGSMLRISLCYGHTAKMTQTLLEALAELVEYRPE